MRLKRVLSAFVAAATAFSIIGSTAVFAAAEPDYIANVDYNNQTTGASGNIYVGTVTTVGVTVKAEQNDEADKYASKSYAASAKNDIFATVKNTKDILSENNVVLPEYVEFDYKSSNLQRQLQVKGTAYSTSAWGIELFRIAGNGDYAIGTGGSAGSYGNMKLESDKWYHIGIKILPAKATVYLYINGTQVASRYWAGGILAKDNWYQFVSNSAAGADEIAIDNIRVYQSADDEIFDAHNAAYSIQLTSASDKIIVDAGKKTITLTENMSFDEIKAGLNIPEGATVTENTKLGGLDITSASGKLSAHYDVISPDDVLISSSVYSIDYEELLISNIVPYTTVADFLSNINSSKTLALTKDGKTVEGGYISSDMILSVADGEEEYTLVLNKGVIDADFESSNAGAANLGSYYGASTSVVTGNFSVETAPVTGSKALKLTTTDGQFNNSSIQFYHNSDFAYNNSYNFEFSFMASSLSPAMSFVTKPSNNVSVFGPKFDIRDGGIYLNQTKIADYKPGKWYNIVFSYDIIPDASDKVSVYVNGDKVADSWEVDTMSTFTYERFEIKSSDDKASELWLDNVKLYPTAECAYDPSLDGSDISVTSDSLKITGTKIELDKDYTCAEIFDMLTLSDNVNKNAIYDSEGVAVEDPDAVITAGMTFEISSKNGKMFKYYEFVYPSAISVTEADSIFTAIANAERLTGNYLLAVSQYDADSVLIDCAVKDIAGGTSDSLTFTKADNAAAVKVLLIEKDTLTPACENITIK